MNNSMNEIVDRISHILSSVKDPSSNLSLSSFLNKKNIYLKGTSIRLVLEIGFPGTTVLEKIHNLASKALYISGFKEVCVDVICKVHSHKVQDNLKPLKGIKNIIVVGSGKGGVGKSTISTNISLALSKLGARVGLLDADIYGPSIPTMLGITKRPESLDNKSMEPLLAFNIQTNSIGFLIDGDSPAIWRGPIVARALEQLLNQTNWRDLDYMIVDMPPGTGDIALTLAQKVPIVGSVIVTTPQDVALLDARRCLKMFQKVRIPILGIVENMALYKCPKCDFVDHIFGKDGGKNLAIQNEIRCLGTLPLEKKICQQSDIGAPPIFLESENSDIFLDIAQRLAIEVSLLPRDTSSKIPPIIAKT